MKGVDIVSDEKMGRIGGAYINHALSGSGGSLNLMQANGSSQKLQNSHKVHPEIQGSSDFICKFLFRLRTLFPEKREILIISEYECKNNYLLKRNLFVSILFLFYSKQLIKLFIIFLF